MQPTQIQQNRLYGDLAHLWPLVSPIEEYAAEAGFDVECCRREFNGADAQPDLLVGILSELHP
ncbi:MAG: hypothetical protein QM570_12020 [Planctomycetota bacterium]|nr:hypothetical protein [Planctomycetota bacterium]